MGTDMSRLLPYNMFELFYGGFLSPGCIPGPPAPMHTEADMYMFPDPDHLDAPLPKLVTSWAEKEQRVEWVLANFSEGELALVYRTLREGKDYRNTTPYAIEKLIENERGRG